MAATTTPERTARPTRFALDAVTLLIAEVWLVALLPGRLVVAGLGGIGSPALILGAGLFLLWIVSVLTPGLGVARSCVPLRIALSVVWVSILVPFALMNFHAVPSDQLLNSERYLITMTAFSAVALTAAEGLRNEEEVLRVLRNVVAAVAVMSAIGILQFRPGFDVTKYLAKIPLLVARGDLSLIQGRGSFSRPSSTTLHPIEFGVIVAATLAFAIHLALYDVGRKKWKRYLPVGLIALAIPVSVSRSALLVAGVVLGFFFAGTTPVLRRRGSLLVIGFVVVVFVTIPGMIGTLKGFVSAGRSDSSISHRTYDYSYAAHYIRHAPWFGRGPGTFLPPTFRILDNQYLVTLIESGIVGMTSLIGLFATTVLFGRGARKRLSSESDRNLGQMFAGAGLGALVAAATFDSLSFPTVTALTAVTTGLAAAFWCLARERARLQPASSQDDSICRI